MIRRELIEAASRAAQGLRVVNLCDSRVALGAFAKGRSSSRALNKILRSCLVWSLAGSKLRVNLWIHTDSNPADYPSRNKPIPKPLCPEDDELDALGPEWQAMQSIRSHAGCWAADPAIRSAGARRSGVGRGFIYREVFGLVDDLCREFEGVGVLSTRSSPREAGSPFPSAVFSRLLEDAKKQKQLWHFRVPVPLCDELLRQVLVLCEKLHENESFFTFELPACSSSWTMPNVLALLARTRAVTIKLKRCCFGMIGPSHVKKPLCFAGTLPDLSGLRRGCRCSCAPGLKGSERGCQALPSHVVSAHRRYPKNLCSAYVAVLLSWLTQHH